LITLFFIIAITAAIGISLMQVRQSQEALHESRFLVQSSAILEDVLGLMTEVEKIAEVSDAESLNLFLLSTSFIPLELQELLVKIEISSAVGKININSLATKPEFQEAFRNYASQFNVQDVFFLNDILIDAMSGDKESYKTNIFDERPELYRQRIVSNRHLDMILDFYVLERHGNSVLQLPWDQLVRFDENNNSKLDANYITADLWQMLLPGVSQERAIELSSGEMVYATLEDLELNEEQKVAAQKFSLGFYEPVVHLNIEMMESNSSARIDFDYDLSSKKGKHFEFGI